MDGLARIIRDIRWKLAELLVGDTSFVVNVTSTKDGISPNGPCFFKNVSVVAPEIFQDWKPGDMLTYTEGPFSHTVKAGEVVKISPEQLDAWVQETYGRPTPTAQE